MIEIKGEDQLLKLAKYLRAAGEKDLARELNQGLRTAMEPTKINIKASARVNLPAHGGFNRKVAAMRFAIRISQRNGIRLVASHRYQLKLIDQGAVRHPLFADREHWYLTRFAPGALTNPFEESVGELRRSLDASGQRTFDKIR